MSRYRFAVGLSAVAAVGWSCTEVDVTPAALPDPAGIAALMGQYSEAVNTPAMQSLAAFARPLAVFGADVASLAGVLQGKTIEWNATTDVLDTTARAGAPATATRVILYTINPLTLRPIEPLVEVGHVDLFAHSDFPDSSSIRYLVTSSGAVVLADFLAHAHATATNTVQAEGFVTNGTRRLNFVIPYNYKANAHTELSTFFDMVTPAHRIIHRAALPKPGDSTLSSQIVVVVASDSVFSYSDLTASANGQITGVQQVIVNRLFFAESDISGTGTDPRGPRGRDLTAEEAAAVNAIHALAVQLALFVEFPVLTIYNCGC